MDRGDWWATVHGVTKSQTVRVHMSARTHTHTHTHTHTRVLKEQALIAIRFLNNWQDKLE